MAGAPVIPAPHHDDDDDVAWALQTAAIQWQRGGKADAVVWLRRAVDAAIAAGNPARTKELTRLASEVAGRVERETAGGRQTAPSESGEAVDALLAGEPIPGFHGPPGPRVTAHSLSGEIPIDFEDVTDVSDDLEDDAETLPPPRRSSAPSRAPSSRVPSHTPSIDELDEPEQDVSGDDLFSVPPGAEPIDDDYQEVEEVSEESFVGSVAEPESMEMLASPLSGGDSDDDGIVHSSEFLDEPEDYAGGVHDELTQDASVPPLAEPPPASGVSAGRPEVGDPPLRHIPEDSVPDDDGQEGDDPTTPWSSRPPPPGQADPGISVPSTSRLPEVDDEDEDETGEIPIAPAVPGAPDAAGAPERGTQPDDEPRAPMLSAPVIAPAVDDILLEGVRGFEDLPEDMQRLIVSTAVLTTLSADDEVGSFGAALVTRGKVGIMPAVADVSAAVASAGEVVFTRGTLEERIPLRVVALEDGTVVASWTSAVLETAFADCPWVADELRQVADRFQALAGATLGALGERLDDVVRDLVFSRLDVKAFEPGEVIVTGGKPVPGLHIVGAGRVELEGGESASPGEFLFAAEVLGAGKAHATARAGKTGALILFTPRATAHELLLSVPVFLEILAG